jgi:hypothetical protein
MAALLEQSQPLPVPYEEGGAPLQQAGQVLQAFLTETGLGTRNQGGQVLGLMAQHAAETETATGRLLPTAYFKQAIAPDATKDPSGWMAPLWGRLLKDEPGWQTGLVETARRLGKGFSPRLIKKDSASALYGIEPVPVPLAPETAVTRDADVPAGGVRYTTEQATVAAAWLRWWMKGGSARWTVLPRIIVLSVYLVVVAMILMLILLGLARSRAGGASVTFSDLWLFFMLACFGWLARELERFLSALFDLRIVMAPLILTRFADRAVTLELRRDDDDERDGTRLILSKYSAACPRCGASLEVADGGQAFPERLVGRCVRSPREHVYGFDPVLRVGGPLR